MISDEESPDLATFRPKVSVVINTLNRGWIIGGAIHSLRYQDYPHFEVIVVNGPSNDNTDTILAALDGEIKVERIAEANLSKSRNAGIAAASGEIVLFLDDDAFAEPGWITNIVAAYEDPRVAGVGTRVWDHYGFKEQLNPRLIDEYYNPIFDAQLPSWAFDYPDSRTIPHILGASSSFRREILLRIGGFDEEIEYFLDESEVCRRIVEQGYLIRFLETGASVHHKYAPGVVRDERKLLTHPYPVVKNKFYVVLADADRHARSMQQALTACTAFADQLLNDAQANFATRAISPKEFERFREDVMRGVTDGRARGFRGTRKSGNFVQKPPAFLEFPTLRPKNGARTFCFICRYLPQRSPGGVAKFVYDLALGFASLGHHVTIVTEAEGKAEIQYRDGIWIRALAVGESPQLDPDIAANLESGAARDNFAWSAMAHSEILRMRLDRPVDLVVTPIWNTEGLHCVLDDTLKTVVTLQTTFKTFSEIEWQKLDAATSEELLIFEQILVERARHVHAISDAINHQVREGYRPRDSAEWVVAHLGVDDLTDQPALVEPSDGTVCITYVSRLEKRKGTDVFLAAAMKLVTDHDNVRIELIGRDVTAHAPGSGYENIVSTLPPNVRKRIVFRGQVDDEEVVSAYTKADIFCVPSRFESFGLIYLEAMRAGKPVVACRVGGVPELVRDGVTGLLVPPDDTASLSAALDRLVRDRALRETMGAEGRRRFEAEFTASKMVERTLAAYEAMIDA